MWTEYWSGFSTASRGITSIKAVNDTIVWTQAYDGANTSNYIREVSLSTDGMNWTERIMDDPNNANFSTMALGCITAIDADTAYAALWPNTGSICGVWKTIDGGMNWSQSTGAAYTSASFPDVVHFFNATTGMSMGDPVGGYFEIYVTSDAGASWTRVPNTGNQLSASVASEYGLTDVYTTLADTIWFGTDHGRIFKSIDYGNTWTVSDVKAQVPAITSISKIAFRDGMNGMCSMYNSTTSAYVSATTTDGGVTWTALTPSGNMYNSDYCSVPGTNIYVSVGADPNFSGSSMSMDDGATWMDIEDQSALPNPVQRTSVAFTSDTVGYSGSFTDGSVGGMWKWQGPVVPLPVGVKSNNAVAGKVKVFPNPANDYISVQMNGFTGKETSVKVMNMLGETVFSYTKTMETPIFIKHFDMSSLAPGVYTVNVTSGSSSFVEKVVKN